MRWELFFLNPAVVWVLIPVTAILVGGIQQLVKMICRHRERIAMIEQGMNPDAFSDIDQATDSIASDNVTSPNDWRLRTTTGTGR